jgi:hypothetical protein
MTTLSEVQITDQHRIETIRMWRHANCGTCKTQADAVECDHAEGLYMNAVVDQFIESYAFSIDGSPDCNNERDRSDAFDRCKELAWSFDQERSAFDDLIVVAAHAYSQRRAALHAEAARINEALDNRNALWKRERACSVAETVIDTAEQNAKRSVDLAKACLDAVVAEHSPLVIGSSLTRLVDSCRIAFGWIGDPVAKGIDRRAALAELVMENEALKAQVAELKRRYES